MEDAKLSRHRPWSLAVRITALVFGITLIFEMRLQAGSGLDVPEPIGQFLNGNLPSQTPEGGSGVGDWSLVDAFPSLSFTNPLFMTPYPGTNDLVMLEHHGLVYLFDNSPSASGKQLILDIRDRVQDTHWGGLLSMAFHPEFGQSGSPNRGFVYFAYRYAPEAMGSSSTHFVPGYLRVSRFEYNFGLDEINASSEFVLIQQYDTSKHHLGGSITFGADGFLYISRGDEWCCNDPSNATQKLNVGLFSGILRIDVDNNASLSHAIRRQPQDNYGNRPGHWPASYTQGYSIPNDNPWQDPSGGILEEFYAIGLRSPHSISYDSATSKIWIADVGETQREEIDLLTAGANYQWPFREGNTGGPKARPSSVIGTEKGPVAEYGHSGGANCIIGGHIYHGSEHASLLGGKYLFADNGNQKVWAMTYTPGQPGQIEELCVGPSGSYYTGFSGSGRDANGEVYFLKMTGHNSSTGKVMKLSRAGSSTPDAPALLSQTGAFQSLSSLTPTNGLLPYDMNTPLFSDSAKKRRWFAIPNDGSHNTAGEKISYTENGNWGFPTGAVLVKHFDLPTDELIPSVVRRMETRFMVLGIDGQYFGFTYRWRPDGSDADLLTDGLDETVAVRKADGSTVNRTWHYPSRTECFSCHSSVVGYVLGPRTRQLNRNFTYPKTGRTGNQLETLQHLGMFTPNINPALLPGVLTSAPIDDASHSLQKRALSYLDSNCSNCHQPGGSAHANFDARLFIAPGSQGIVNAIPNNNFGIPNARVVAPQDVSRSVLHHRANLLGAGAMPPLAKNQVDDAAIELIENWIDSLDPSVSPPTTSTSDVIVPIPSLSASPSYSGSLVVSVAFSEPVYGLTTDDFQVTNGTAIALAGLSTDYSLTVAPSASTVTVALPSDKVIDVGSNANPPSNSVVSTALTLPVLSISGGSANEGSGMLAFGVSLSAAAPSPVAVQYLTTNGSAVSPWDYSHSNGTLTIPAGATSATLAVPVTDDIVDEATESFSISLSNPSGVTLGASSAVGTITDNDSVPSISIGNAANNESVSGMGFSIVLSHPSASPVTVRYATANGSALAGADYTSSSGMATFQPGQTSLSLVVSLTGDFLDEANETFFVQLSNPENAVLSSAIGTGTIIDDDRTPQISIAGGSANEGAGQIVFDVGLSTASGSSVSVAYATSARSASAGIDFSPASGTLTLPAGATVATLAIPILDDVLTESDEDFAVTISNPRNAILGTASAVGVIIDNDELPIVSVAAASASEASGSVVFPVSLSTPSGVNVTVVYATTAGTANSPGDFQAISGTLSIPAGQTSAQVSVPLTNDTAFEGNETFSLVLSSPVNAALGHNMATGTIVDEDSAPELTIGDGSVTEDFSSIYLPMSLSSPSDGRVSFFYATVEGTATPGQDYSPAAGRYVIPAGVTSFNFAIPLAPDDVHEENESFTVEFSAPENCTLIQKIATATIIDDDPEVRDDPVLSVASLSVGEGGAAAVTVSLSEATDRDVTVTYETRDGTASSGNDYTPVSGVIRIPASQATATISVVTVDDGVRELDETFEVVLSDPVDAVIGAGVATATIIDNEETPSVSARVTSSPEAAGKLVFAINLSGPSSLPVSLNYEARPGSAGIADFESRSGAITIPANSTQTSVEIRLIDDDLDEPDESIVFELVSAENAQLAANPNAVGLILDDDDASVVSVHSATASEGETALQFAVTLSKKSGRDVSVDWVASAGTAQAGVDFTARSGVLTILAGESTATISISLLADDLPEFNETVKFSLSDPLNGLLGASIAEGTILDDDGVPSISVTAVALEESDGEIEFPIVATGIHSEPMSVSYTILPDTASAGEDYTPQSGVATIAPGATRTTVAVPIREDELDEGSETLFIELSAPVNASLRDSRAPGIIFDDDDAPSLAIHDSTASEGANVLSFPVTLSVPSGRDVSVDWATSAATAVAGADFVAGSGTLTIPAGSTEASINIPLLDDNVFEGGEVFTVNLGSPQLVEVAKSSATGTIDDDEELPILAVNSTVVSESEASVLLTVSSSIPSAATISFRYDVVGETAGSDDLVIDSGTAFLADGETETFVRVVLKDDTLDESNESFALVLSNPVNAAIGIARGVVTLVDDDAVPNLEVVSGEQSEGMDTLSFDLKLSNPSSKPVTVAFNVVSNTATAGEDFAAISGTAEIAPGKNQASILVPLLNDAIDEPEETLTLVLTDPVNARLVTDVATGTIIDDDEAPQITIIDASGSEGSPVVVFEVKLSQPSALNISMDCVTESGTAIQGVDFHPELGPVTIPAGASSILITIPLIADEIDEPDETFAVVLSDPVNATIKQGHGSGIIMDDDAAPRLAIHDSTTSEGANVLSFPVTLSVPSGRDVSVDWATRAGTAVAGADFVAGSGTLTIPAGSTEAWINILLLDDTLDESNESFALVLSDPVNAAIGVARGVVTLVDDDAPPALRISNASASESSGIIEFAVTLSAPSGHAVDVTYASRSVTAANGDYESTQGKLTFLPGVTTQTLVVKLFDDRIVERPEQFILQLSGAVNAVIEDGKGIGIIGDDDEEQESPIADAVLAYSMSDFRIYVDPESGERYLDLHLTGAGSFDSLTVTLEISSDLTEWKRANTGDWFLEEVSGQLRLRMPVAALQGSTFLRLRLFERDDAE
jgi:uncharacterized repeat protein (TIGR03806 family)